ncbi:sigma-70 family RNA polymerase sigma factor [Paenibacillus albicereus]|uniref:Sigma-70 family RNA polymerase sigma factor n=1 Tax=Paenibacillus albicereus TaxID=2726185 RepID=A0A6H2GTL2_9BACL|nr:sigma-70 family RNA polymerase sigma factor [Paenibacillus albicereus]QJC50506.1 sigma-70 family RNA polymerase sigma factor [Paenibacillus albicereus]
MRGKLDYLQHLGEGYDRGAVLEQLMERFGGDVWRFAFFLTGSREAADDVSQETFLAAYRSLYSFRGGEASAKSWLLKITRNKALHQLQGAFRRRVRLTGRPPASGAEPAAEQIHFARAERAELWTAVLALPLKLKEALLLDFHYGMSLREIAELTGVPEGTVKSRIHRAKKKLRAQLGGMDDGR